MKTTEMPKNNLPAAIRWLRQQYAMPPSPVLLKEINCGYCADFATQIWHEYPQVEIWCDEDFGADYTHTFLYFDHKFYDAEAPDGVDSWVNLPIFKRQIKEGRKSLAWWVKQKRIPAPKKLRNKSTV